jgi:GNAT superfamily N-acetyltransferase
MNIYIRKALRSDIQDLLRINHSSFEANASYDRYIDMNWIHTRDAKWHFLKSVTKDGYYSIVAEIDNKPVGFLILSPKKYSYRTVKMIELDILAVLPEYRSGGVGKSLIDEAKRWARENGYQTIYASSYFKNERAVNFYTREGFTSLALDLEFTL